MDNYIVYRRKSTDSEDKQVLSLESQELALKDSIPGYNSMNIVANFDEAKTAKCPGRKKFNEMCSLLNDGKANNIICWHLNRLARNPIDGGAITWLVQEKNVKIVTPSKIYDHNDVTLLYIEFAMSNLFITDLRKNTMRGLNDKLRMGLAPQLAPIGYVNDVTKRQGERDILQDPARFHLVRKMWDLLLTGQYSPPRILQIATDEWGLRHRSGKTISRSKIYDLFRNRFYTGKFVYLGEVHQGNHQPMITMDEFNRAQALMGVRGFQGVYKHVFAFKGFLQCSCGGTISAYERYRKICPGCHHKYNAMANESCPKCKTLAPEKTSYFCYYQCINRKPHVCMQPAIRSDELERQLDTILSDVSLPQEFIDWALEKLRSESQKEQTERQASCQDVQNNVNATTRKLDMLLNKYLSQENKQGELFSDEEYKHEKAELIKEKMRLETSIQNLSNRQLSWMVTAEKALNVARDCLEILHTGTNDEKIEMMYSLGLHLSIEDKMLRYDWPEPYKTIISASERLKQQKEKFEPVEEIVTKRQTFFFDARNPVWGG